MKALVRPLVAAFARQVLARHTPFVIGVTGSVGKSSAKQAIGAVLSGFRVRMSPKSYNTELGVPLSILGLESPGRSVIGWLSVLLRAWKRSMTRNAAYPNTLVLEMAADRPGDIATLVSIAHPRIGVVTGVGESHAMNFGSVAAIAKEKGTLVEKLPKDGFAILNRDDDEVWEMRKRTKAKVMTYGFHEEADVRGLPDSIGYACLPTGECGTHAKVEVEGSTVPVFVPKALGWPSVYAALAAVAVGRARGLNLVDVIERLRAYQPPPGRMRYIPGIKHTILIDDTYNAAPKSMEAALDVLADIPLGGGDDKRIAVLGDMLELGSLSEEGHRRVGKRANELGIDLLILVGERMGDAKNGAKEAGMDESRIFHFATPQEAGRFTQERMKQGDVVLVKGSRGMRMEIVVKELMADPTSATSELVSVIED
jgi:UDP-N-acetylmuramoyl-tripeptide--D-alanyl-D-alanine ligase